MLFFPISFRTPYSSLISCFFVCFVFQYDESESIHLLLFFFLLFILCCVLCLNIRSYRYFHFFFFFIHIHLPFVCYAIYFSLSLSFEEFFFISQVFAHFVILFILYFSFFFDYFFLPNGFIISIFECF